MRYRVVKKVEYIYTLMMKFDMDEIDRLTNCSTFFFFFDISFRV